MHKANVNHFQNFLDNIFHKHKTIQVDSNEFLWKSEKLFNISRCSAFIKDQPYLPVGICVLYLLSCVLGAQFMRSRQPIVLKWLRAVWNLAFAIFSLIGALRIGPFLWRVYCTQGIEGLVYHDPKLTHSSRILTLWTQLFVLSKVVDLFDTLFLLLDKKEISFIHRYHHITVLVYSWHCYTTDAGISLSFLALNYVVHTIMYFFYFLQNVLTDISIWLPGWVLTAFQIFQMFVGMSLCITSAILQYDNWLQLLKVLQLIKILRQFHLLTFSRLPVTLEWLERFRIIPPLEIAKTCVEVYLTVSYIILWMMLWQKGWFMVGSMFIDNSELINEVNEQDRHTDLKNLKVVTVSDNNTLKGESMVFAWTPHRGSKQWARSMRRLPLPKSALRRCVSCPHVSIGGLTKGFRKNLSFALCTESFSPGNLFRRPSVETFSPRNLFGSPSSRFSQGFGHASSSGILWE